MEKEIVVAEEAPAAIGHYSQGIRFGDLIYTAGQAGLDPATNQIVDGGPAQQADQTMRNLQAILEAAGSSLEDVIKTTIFLRYIKDFKAVNEVYARYMGENKPARSTVAVSSLPMQALVEIEMLAWASGPVKKTKPPSDEELQGQKNKKKGKKKGKKKK